MTRIVRIIFVFPINHSRAVRKHLGCLELYSAVRIAAIVSFLMNKVAGGTPLPFYTIETKRLYVIQEQPNILSRALIQTPDDLSSLDQAFKLVYSHPRTI